MGQTQSQNSQQSRMQVPKINELQFWRQVNDFGYGEIKVYKLNDRLQRITFYWLKNNGLNLNNLPVYKLTDIQELNECISKMCCQMECSYNLSPEQLQFLKQRVLRPTYDLDKSDVFSIGLTALQMATLNSTNDNL